VYVGQPVPRREDERILRGRSRFLDDIVVPELAHMAFVRSPHAHALVHSVDGGPGVIAADDLRGCAWPFAIDTMPGTAVSDVPHPLLADGEVRYVGQPVAAVVAETRALAEDAAERVRVSYEPLEPVADARAGPPMLRFTRVAGDVAAANAPATSPATRVKRSIGDPARASATGSTGS